MKVERDAQRTHVLEEHLCSVGTIPRGLTLSFPAQSRGPIPGRVTAGAPRHPHHPKSSLSGFHSITCKYIEKTYCVPGEALGT